MINKNFYQGYDFINSFGANAEQLFVVTTIGEFAQKSEICNLKYSLNFSKNFGETEQHFSRFFLLHLRVFEYFSQRCKNKIESAIDVQTAEGAGVEAKN